MQEPQRLKIRFGISQATPVDLDKVIPIFHSWIQKEKAPATMIDVADYKHVPAGPGVMLVGHADDLGLDNGARIGEEQQGFYYVRMHGRLEDELPLAERLQEIWLLAIEAGRLLEAEPGLDIAIDPCHCEVSLLDRLLYPPSAATLGEAESEVSSFLSRSLGGSDFTLVRSDTDFRESLSWLAKSSERMSLDTLAALAAV